MAEVAAQVEPDVAAREAAAAKWDRDLAFVPLLVGIPLTIVRAWMYRDLPPTSDVDLGIVLAAVTSIVVLGAISTRRVGARGARSLAVGVAGLGLGLWLLPVTWGTPASPGLGVLVGVPFPIVATYALAQIEIARAARPPPTFASVVRVVTLGVLASLVLVVCMLGVPMVTTSWLTAPIGPAVRAESSVVAVLVALLVLAASLRERRRYARTAGARDALVVEPGLAVDASGRSVAVPAALSGPLLVVAWTATQPGYRENDRDIATAVAPGSRAPQLADASLRIQALDTLAFVAVLAVAAPGSADLSSVIASVIAGA